MHYRGENLKEISFPLGGIGTGCIGLGGNGHLCDWEIFNRPNKGGENGYSGFAVRARLADGSTVTKVLQGDHEKELSGHFCAQPAPNVDYHVGFGYGPGTTTLATFPHFRSVEFDAQYPLAHLTFRDEAFPGTVRMTAFNPLIPLQPDDSSIPAAFFEIEVENGAKDAEYTLVAFLHNPFESSRNSIIPFEGGTAVQLSHASAGPEELAYGDLTLSVDRSGALVQEYWYRGGWQDGISTFWHELTHDRLGSRHYDEPARDDTCTLGATASLKAGEKENFRFVLSWNVPNCCNYWYPYQDENGRDVQWKNYYATLFRDSAASNAYAMQNWPRLYRDTRRFCDILHGSTLDEAVIDAASASLAVLKSPTVLRLQDGTFYGWEGVSTNFGSCEGTCTHVWSYAYALCFLFPTLERSLRDTEFWRDTMPDGGMIFRTPLPPERPRAMTFRPCLDGQMASVIKTYREWKLSGDDDWLRCSWPVVKKLLEYAWSKDNFDAWDADKDGVLEGRQHHTLDVEQFGPSAWLEGMYLGALQAASRMAEYLGDTDAAKEYEALYRNGRQWTKDNLFNGSYYIHKIDLTDKSYTEKFDCPVYWNEEKQQLKYQIGEGCEIDQLLGQWHASLCGLGDLFDPEQRKIALRNMFRNNFKPSLREFANPWRVFALNDEGGAVICDYPEGSEKPVLPIPYCEECMTGFEYAFAGMLVADGFTEEGLAVVRAIRDRYDGKKRNPWNEIECGSNYARPMASFALLPIFSGFSFDLSAGKLGFAPRLDGTFRCLWSVGTGWGEFSRTAREARISLAGGQLLLSGIDLGGIGKVSAVCIDGKDIAFTQLDDSLTWEKQTATREIRVSIRG